MPLHLTKAATYGRLKYAIAVSALQAVDVQAHAKLPWPSVYVDKSGLMLA